MPRHEIPTYRLIPTRRTLLRTAAAGVPLALLTACASSPATETGARSGGSDGGGTDLGGSDGGGDVGPGQGSDVTEENAKLAVYAAASLAEILDELVDKFMEAHPTALVATMPAGSADLVAQLDAGAMADVLITADQMTMARAQDQGNIAGEPVVFATNVPVLITAPNNPHGITSLADVASPAGVDLALVTCAPQVPCGAAAAAVADHEGLTLSPVSEENAVTDVLGKVLNGQADAGIVYLTDALTAGDEVHMIELPGAEEARTEYPAAVAAEATSPTLARHFIDFLAAPEAQKVLADAGFGSP